MTDGELLLRYVKDHSDASFEELVKRHINLIYSAALRQMNGDGHLAEDVTQSVFADLARKASSLTSHPSLTGWLYTTTRYMAANTRRTEQRRGLREQQAHTMNAILNSPDAAPDWSDVSPVLDEVMHLLDEPDRAAVLMRHFEGRSYAEIGTSVGLSENAARMRVERALDKLRGLLAHRGVTSTAAALAAIITANAVGAAPAHLTAKVMATLGTAATVAGTTAGLAHFFQSTFAKVAAGLIVAGAVALLTVTLVSHRTHAATPGQDPSATSDRTNAASAPLASAAAPQIPILGANTNGTNSANHKSRATNGLVLRLEITAADSGKPIPMIHIDYRAWSNNRKFKNKTLSADRFGICNVIYPTNTTELELTTRQDGFADTCLLWHPGQGETIPTNYVLRLDRPAQIGGRVVDPDGKPVAGAKVGWNHNDDPNSMKAPESHEFFWIETTTDSNGVWSINRIAEDMLHRIYGSASHTNYVATSLVEVGSDKTVEAQLRAGTYTFTLGRATAANGLVTDADGNPIADAQVNVGCLGMSGMREGKSRADGTFTIDGCQPGKAPITAVTPGFAPTTMDVSLPNDASPAHLILKPGVLLLVRVLDPAGHPIPHANIWKNNFESNPDAPTPTQVEFSPVTDQDGRARMENAPDEEMTLEVAATGFCRNNEVKIHPDGTEHVITLNPSLIIHGTVTDANTGQPIPKFRIAQGWPNDNPVDKTSYVRWSTIGRFWLNFAGGTYSNSFDEPVLGGVEKPQYVLKFMADGYSPFVSRVIAADEGNIELNVTLKPAASTTVTVYRPDGTVAPGVDIGLVSPGSAVSLGKDCIDRKNVQNGGSLLRSDASGTFVLPGDDSITKVIAISPDGYGESTPAALAEQPYLQLKPWGSIEATCLAGSQPVPGHVYGISFADEPEQSLSFSLDFAHFTTDAQGHITIPHAPSGHLALTRLYTFSDGPHSGGWSYGRKTTFDVQPGQTTAVDLGSSNYVVTAHIKWTDGLTRQPGWNITAGTSSSIHTGFRTESHPATADPNNNNILSSDDLAPGDYDLSVMVLDGPLAYTGPPRHIKQVAAGTLHFTLPADPGTGNIDLGDIEMKPVTDAQ